MRTTGEGHCGHGDRGREVRRPGEDECRCWCPVCLLAEIALEPVDGGEAKAA